MTNPPHFSTGKIMPQMDEPSIGHMVVKCGSVTGLTHGLLALDGGIFRLENRELRLPGLRGQLSQERIIMYLVESINNLPFFYLGDSGSLVFMHDDDKSLKCIGMAVGMTTHGGCIVTPIEAILKAFGIHDDDNGPPFLPFNDGDDDYGDDDNDKNRFDEKGRDNPKKRSRQPDNHLSGMDHSGLDTNFERRQRKQPRYRHTSRRASIEKYLRSEANFIDHDDSSSIDLVRNNSSFSDSNDWDGDSDEDYMYVQGTILSDVAEEIVRKRAKEHVNKAGSTKAKNSLLLPTDNPDNYKERWMKSRSEKDGEDVKHVHNVKSDDSQVTGVNVDPTVTVRDTSLEICVTGNQHVVYNHFESNTGKRTLVVPTSEIRALSALSAPSLFDHFQRNHVKVKKLRKSQELLHKTFILYGFIYFCLAVFKTTFGSEEEIQT